VQEKCSGKNTWCYGRALVRKNFWRYLALVGLTEPNDASNILTVSVESVLTFSSLQFDAQTLTAVFL